MSVSRRAGCEAEVNFFQIAKPYIFSLFENKYSDETRTTIEGNGNGKSIS